MLHRVAALISRQALQHNLAVARRHAGERRLVAVVKANAYGHGLLPVAEALHEADMFGVTDVNEAETLRAAGCDKPILVLQGLIDRDDVPRIDNGAFDLVVHRAGDLSLLEAAFDAQPPAAPLRLWLKLQSGMGRLGLEPAALPTLYRALRAKPWVREIVVMTHLANSGLPDSGLNRRQLDCFGEVHGALDDAPPASIAASAGLLALDCGGDWVRPGLMLYGSSPFAWEDSARRREALDLRPVMTLQARLIAIAEHTAGDNIGYNSQFICPGAMRVGIVSAGYADGYPSNTPNGCPVSVKGKRSQTIGRVSMDMLAIDLSEIPEAMLDDPVTLWGEAVSIDEVAAHTGVISYNLASSVAPRVARHYV